MIKKVKVIETYNIALYCDKCGRNLLDYKTNYNHEDGIVDYIYTCECGNVMLSKIHYPYQQIITDEGNAEIINEQRI